MGTSSGARRAPRPPPAPAAPAAPDPPASRRRRPGSVPSARPVHPPLLGAAGAEPPPPAPLSSRRPGAAAATVGREGPRGRGRATPGLRRRWRASRPWPRRVLRACRDRTSHGRCASHGQASLRPALGASRGWGRALATEAPVKGTVVPPTGRVPLPTVALSERTVPRTTYRRRPSQNLK